MLINCALIGCICRRSSSRSCISVDGSTTGVVEAGMLGAVGANATELEAKGVHSTIYLNYFEEKSWLGRSTRLTATKNASFACLH